MSTIPQEVIDAIDEGRWSLGETRRILHNGCSNGKDSALSISRVQGGWLYHCFRCQECEGFVSSDRLSPGDVLKQLQATHDPAFRVIEAVQLPDDCIPFYPDKLNPKIPAAVYVWLWKYHMKFDMMEKHGLAWSPQYQRLIVPVYDTILMSRGDVGRKLLGWLGRDVSMLSKSERVSAHRPKWLTRKDKSAKHFFYHLLSEDRRLVIVEDVISAIRVHEATGFNTLALNTTFLPSDIIVKLKTYKVYLWLDGDMLHKKVNYAAVCSALGVKVKIIHTQMDPKEHGSVNILKTLGEK